MRATKTKLSLLLSEEDLLAFLDLCRKEPNLTGLRIQEIAADLGIEIGHNSAYAFLEGEYEPYCEALRSAHALAQHLSAVNAADAAGTIADAGAGHLGQMTFEYMLDATSMGNGDSKLERMDTLSKIFERLRKGDVAREALQLRVNQLEEAAKKREREIAEREKSIAAARKRLEEAGNADDPTRRRILDEVDRVMGLPSLAKAEGKA